MRKFLFEVTLADELGPAPVRIAAE
jgi:hypothetical protein